MGKGRKKRQNDVVVRTALRHSAVGVTASKLALLREVGRRYQIARRIYEKQFYPTMMIAAVLGSADDLTTKRWQSGFAPVELLTHHHKMAMEDAVAIVRGGWALAFSKVAALVIVNKRWNQAEREEILYLLAAPSLIAKIVLGEVIDAPKSEWVGNNQRVLCAYLRRMILCRRTPTMRHKRASRQFVSDNTGYRLVQRPEDKHFRGIWISLSTLPGNKPVMIPLAGRDLAYLDTPTRRNLRITIENGRIKFAIPRDVTLPAQAHVGSEAAGQLINQSETVGIDVGLVWPIVATAGAPEVATFHGKGLGEIATAIAEGSDHQNRSRLWSYVQKLEKSGDPADVAKAGRIRAHNLTSVKQSRHNAADHETIVNRTNQVVKEMFSAHPAMGTLVSEDLSRMRGDTGKGKKLNRRVSRWQRRALNDALERNASANGVRRQLVNAAYTSQACPRCSWVEPRNRWGQVFHCRYCGYVAHADALASSNVRFRLTDLEITRFMRRALVKSILLARCHRQSDALPGDQTATM